MEQTGEEKSKKCCGGYGARGADSGGLVWLLGVIGSAVYYIQQANGFGEGVVGFLKALVWPAMLVYELLSFLGM